MILGVTTKFDAAHFLPDYDGKCKNQHGHTWHVEMQVLNHTDPTLLNTLSTPTRGMAMDFNKMKEILNSVVDRLDHTLLNDTVENPTCEQLAYYILNKVSPLVGHTVAKIKIKEGEGGWVETEWY